MGKVHPAIDGRLRTFIEAQHVFFVATAPSEGGHVNVSPKGVGGTFRVVDEHTVAYLDITASGAETVAHLRDNGRITLMFCSFDRTPNVVRLHGRGRVVSIYDEEFADWAARFPENPAARAVIVVDVERVSDSCGYALPLLTLDEERDLLTPNMERRGADGIVDYRRRKNRTSLDGLPAFDDDPLDEWSTPEGLAAIRLRLGGQLPGWQAPASYGIAIDGDFPHANLPGGTHGLPAVVLGTVLKHDGSTATLDLARPQLDEAIGALAPAEACTELEHPNLAAWREIATRLDAAPGGRVQAVFVRSADDPVSSETDAALRALWPVPPGS
jgi:predicted pyridoxine 5'-phosphate oxidase superfamily flavin-nucleotide-binding protein